MVYFTIVISVLNKTFYDAYSTDMDDVIQTDSHVKLTYL